MLLNKRKKLEMNRSKLDIQNRNQKRRRKRRENISERGEGLKDIKKKKEDERKMESDKFSR